MAMSFPGFKLEDKANAMKWFFLIFPHYSLSSSLNNLNTINTMDRVCQQKCDQLLICDRELLCKMVKQCCGKNKEQHQLYIQDSRIIFHVVSFISENLQ